MKKEHHRFVAYAVQRFPALRTTFIRRELDALRELGIPLEVLSMRPFDKTEIANEVEARQYIEGTHYLPSNPLDIESIFANLIEFVRHPTRSLHAWQLIVADPGGPGFKRRAKLFIQIWRAAVMAQRLRGFGNCIHIHAQFADGAATTAVAAARLLDVPFSFMSHTSYDSPALEQKLESAKFVASISEFDRRKLISKSNKFKNVPIEVVRCGIPLEQWPFKPNAKPKNQYKIISVGALIEKKGHDVLIDACKLLVAEGHEFHCDIIGGGPLLDILCRKVEASGLDTHVRLLGPMPQEKIQKAIYTCDLFVLACRTTSQGDTDGIPVSLMEAMAAGRPVVSCDVAGIPELVMNERTGWLVSQNDSNKLAKVMSAVIGRIGSSEVDQIVKCARRHIEVEFDQAAQAKKLAEHFSNALSS